MNKVIDNGYVKVLISPGYGAGWYTWHNIKELVFDPNVIALIENKAPTKDIIKYCEDNYKTGYFGGADQLEIALVPEGSSFLINEYDGYESIEIKSDIKYLQA